MTHYQLVNFVEKCSCVIEYEEYNQFVYEIVLEDLTIYKNRKKQEFYGKLSKW